MKISSTGIIPFISGDIVQLDGLKQENSAIYAKWVNNSHLRRISGKGRIFPVTLEEQKSLVEQQKESLSTSITFDVIDKKSGKLIGITSLERIEYIDSNAEISVMLDPQSDTGLIFKEVVTLLVNYAFGEINLFRLSMNILKIKQDWASIVKDIGMIHELTLKEDRFVDGDYKDVEVYSVLRNEWDKKL